MTAPGGPRGCRPIYHRLAVYVASPRGVDCGWAGLLGETILGVIFKLPDLSSGDVAHKAFHLVDVDVNVGVLRVWGKVECLPDQA